MDIFQIHIDSVDLSGGASYSSPSRCGKTTSNCGCAAQSCDADGFGHWEEGDGESKWI